MNYVHRARHGFMALHWTQRFVAGFVPTTAGFTALGVVSSAPEAAGQTGTPVCRTCTACSSAVEHGLAGMHDGVPVAVVAVLAAAFPVSATVVGALYGCNAAYHIMSPWGGPDVGDGPPPPTSFH